MTISLYGSDEATLYRWGFLTARTAQDLRSLQEGEELDGEKRKRIGAFLEELTNYREYYRGILDRDSSLFSKSKNYKTSAEHQLYDIITDYLGKENVTLALIEAEKLEQGLTDILANKTTDQAKQLYDFALHLSSTTKDIISIINEKKCSYPSFKFCVTAKLKYLSAFSLQLGKYH